MMIRNIPLRHELKYFITPAELTVLRNTLAPLMQLDQGHEYLIRSLYFDTINDDALEEKIAGVGNRKKYRIRIYNFSDRVIKLECKSKYGDLISKQSVSIPRELADQLIAGDPEGLAAHAPSPAARRIPRDENAAAAPGGDCGLRPRGVHPSCRRGAHHV